MKVTQRRTEGQTLLRAKASTRPNQYSTFGASGSLWLDDDREKYSRHQTSTRRTVVMSFMAFVAMSCATVGFTLGVTNGEVSATSAASVVDMSEGLWTLDDAPADPAAAAITSAAGAFASAAPSDDFKKLLAMEQVTMESARKEEATAAQARETATTPAQLQLASRGVQLAHRREADILSAENELKTMQEASELTDHHGSMKSAAELEAKFHAREQKHAMLLAANNGVAPAADGGAHWLGDVTSDEIAPPPPTEPDTDWAASPSAQSVLGKIDNLLNSDEPIVPVTSPVAAPAATHQHSNEPCSITGTPGRTPCVTLPQHESQHTWDTAPVMEAPAPAALPDEGGAPTLPAANVITPDPSEEASAPSYVLAAELQKMTVKELRFRAAAEGAANADIEDARDTEAPKPALIQLILQAVSSNDAPRDAATPVASRPHWAPAPAPAAAAAPAVDPIAAALARAEAADPSLRQVTLTPGYTETKSGHLAAIDDARRDVPASLPDGYSGLWKLYAANLARSSAEEKADKAEVAADKAAETAADPAKAAAAKHAEAAAEAKEERDQERVDQATADEQKLLALRQDNPDGTFVDATSKHLATPAAPTAPADPVAAALATLRAVKPPPPHAQPARLAESATPKKGARLAAADADPKGVKKAAAHALENTGFQKLFEMYDKNLKRAQAAEKHEEQVAEMEAQKETSSDPKEAAEATKLAVEAEADEKKQEERVEEAEADEQKLAALRSEGGTFVMDAAVKTPHHHHAKANTDAEVEAKAVAVAPTSPASPPERRVPGGQPMWATGDQAQSVLAKLDTLLGADAAAVPLSMDAVGDATPSRRPSEAAAPTLRDVKTEAAATLAQYGQELAQALTAADATIAKEQAAAAADPRKASAKAQTAERLRLEREQAAAQAALHKPHVLLVVADDYGWNDVGYHQNLPSSANPKGRPTTNVVVKTPHLDRLAHEGRKLENYYVQPLCSPTRATILTGRNPSHTGVGPAAIEPAWPYGIPKDETTMAEKFKEAGYQTHIVGKWHLGYCDERYSPTFRGFDSFTGYLNGAEDYFAHSRSDENGFSGLDFRSTEQYQRGVLSTSVTKKEAATMNGWANRLPPACPEASGTYSTDAFTAAVARIVSSYAEAKALHGEANVEAMEAAADGMPPLPVPPPPEPLFVYVPFQSVHSAPHYSGAERHESLQAPQRFIDMYPATMDPKRRKYAAMVAALDDAVGEMERVYKQAGIWDSTVLVFTTDNGGPLGSANNFPLRGHKGVAWEGGIRGVSFVRGTNDPSLFPVPGGTVSMELMHSTDWLPTLASLAGYTAQDDPTRPLDGHDQWGVIARGESTKRKVIVHNCPAADAGSRGGAIRVGDYKLLFDDKLTEVPNMGVQGGTEGSAQTPPPGFKIGGGRGQALRARGGASSLVCPLPAPVNGMWLFDVVSDPRECTNLVSSHPDVLQDALETFDAYQKGAVPDIALSKGRADPQADPRLRADHAWGPWADRSALCKWE